MNIIDHRTNIDLRNVIWSELHLILRNNRFLYKLLQILHP